MTEESILPPEQQRQPISVLQQTYLDEFISNVLNEPEDIGIKLLLNIPSEQQQHAKQRHDPSENQIDDTIRQQQQITTLLRRAGVELFHHIETLHHTYVNLLQQQKSSKESRVDAENTTLSGLPTLYVSMEDDTNVRDHEKDNNHNDTTFLDAETIWGQVEIQNNALQTILKRSLRQLIVVSSTSDSSNNNNINNENASKIQLLHDDVADDDDDDDETDDENGEDDDDNIHDENDDDDDGGDDNDIENDVSTDDENMDEETKRIRDRMKRTMEQMSDDDDDDEEDDEIDMDDDNDHALSTIASKKSGSTSLKDNNKNTVDDIENDPAAVQLHDGFFNLQEMEEFADEEEEYLPNDAYGPISTDNNNNETKTKNRLDTRSFHQKQRDGDMANPNETDSDDDDDEDEDEDDIDNEELLFKNTKDDPILQRRKKYRDDEDIEALYHLYDPPDDNGGDNDDDDIIHMTAADLFGPPNRKFYNQWNQKTKLKDEFDDNENDDDDVYEDNMNDFNTSAKRQKSGWNDDDDEEEEDTEKYDENENGDDDDDDDDEDMNKNDDSTDEADFDKPALRDDDGDRSDEEVPMKGNTQNKSKPSQKSSSKSSSKLLELTEQLERDMLAEKPWQMKGETGSSARPVNSLLESTPEFEVATKLNPIITVAHTANLEEIIKQRIIAEDWDDIVPRELPDVGWLNKKNKGELPEVSQEKSKLGLGELYEREYLKKAVGYDVDAAEKLSSEDQLKNELKSLFANVCSKLDALSNYHFTPRPVAGDTEVRPMTVPAIAMEEVLPIHVSDARGVAPEEVYGTKKRGRDAILRDTSEMDQAERKRLRNSKKAARRKERQAKLADEKLISRLEPSLGLNNPYEKRKMREELSMARAGGRVTMGASDTNDKYGTSQTFFQRLQNEAEQTVRNGGSDKNATGTTNNASITGAGKSKSSKSSAYKL